MQSIRQAPHKFRRTYNHCEGQPLQFISINWGPSPATGSILLLQAGDSKSKQIAMHVATCLNSTSRLGCSNNRTTVSPIPANITLCSSRWILIGEATCFSPPVPRTARHKPKLWREAVVMIPPRKGMHTLWVISLQVKLLIIERFEF